MQKKIHVSLYIGIARLAIPVLLILNISKFSTNFFLNSVVLIFMLYYTPYNSVSCKPIWKMPLVLMYAF